MRRGRRLIGVVLAGWAALVAVLGTAAVRMDVLKGTWRDDFTDLTGLAVNQQGSMASPSGFTVDSGLQQATWPSSTGGVSQPFDSEGAFIDTTLTVGNPGSTAEYLTLYNARYSPGSELDVPYDCESVTGSSCKGLSNYYQNGVSALAEIKDVPYEGTNMLPVAGWNTDSAVVDNYPYFGANDYRYIFCRLPKSSSDGTPNPPGMATFLGSPLLGGLRLNNLVAGRGYTATYLAAALLGDHKNHTGTAYIMCQVYDRNAKAAASSVTLYEGQFAASTLTVAGLKGSAPPPGGLSYSNMTPVSVHLDPSKNIAGHTWDLQVFSQVPPREAGTDWGCSHCTMLGPIWLTADEGTYRSPVLDTLSVATRWADICWTVDMSTTYVDSGVSVIPTGAPLTPVRLSYAVSNLAASPISVTFTVTHGGETIPGRIGLNMVDNTCNAIHDSAGLPVTGRFFQWSAQLLGRVASATLDPDLTPYPPGLYFGAFRPQLQRVTAHYFVCACMAQSKRIAPTSVKRWGTVEYVIEKPTPAAVARVSVLGPDGQVILPDVASGTSLAGLDPHLYPVLSLSAALESDPGDCARRPILRAWQVTWEPQFDLLELACNSIRPALGEECPIQIRVDRAGPVLVEVHDAAGQSIKVLLNASVGAAALMLSWNGRNGAGQVVSPGVYFVLAKVPGGRQVKKLAVIR